MSKLYATVSSEKATKYQGGNKKIAGNVTAQIDGKNVEVIRYGIAVNEYGVYEMFIKLWDGRELKSAVNPITTKYPIAQ